MSDMSVVVPVYNGSRYLADTLSSLAIQTIAVDVIVVDDGSSDDSLDIASRHEVGARVIARDNSGVAVARNVGLLEAQTRYVAFLDQDDLWHCERAATLLDLFRTTGAVAVATSEQAFAVQEDRDRLIAVGDGRDLWPSHWVSEGHEDDLLHQDSGGDDSLEELDVRRFMEAPATVTTAISYERTAAVIAGGFAPFVVAADDHILNVNMARIFGPIPRVNRPQLFYRVHPDSVSVSSPLVASYLSALLALRHGRSLPSGPIMSGYLEHLLWQIPDSKSLGRIEQLSLLMMTVPPRERSRWLMRWTKQTIKKNYPLWRHDGSRER